MRRAYFDHAATSPLRPEAREAMEPFLSGGYGNPSSLHEEGRRAKEALEEARGSLAALVGAKPHEIIFTSGGSEANNLAIKGAALALRGKGNHIITTAVEHHSVLDACGFLAGLGFEITRIGVDRDGVADPGDIARAFTGRTILVSVMHGNNETGVLQPVAEIARRAREKGIPVHTDAVQSFGHVPLSVDELDVDLLTATAHKLGGPVGTGFLYVREGTGLVSLIHGGGQEMRHRAGTQNVAGVAGFAKAAAIAAAGLEAESARLRRLRNGFAIMLRNLAGGIIINSPLHYALPGILSVTVPGVDADELVTALDRAGIACSSGAACMSADQEASHVLLAMGRTREDAKCTVRFSLGWTTTAGELERAAEEFACAAGRIKVPAGN